MADALEPSCGDFPMLIEILLAERDLDLGWSERERLADAIAAARLAFLDVMGPVTERKSSTPVTIDPTKLQYKRKENKQ